ncbi:hypothetical protein BCR42DRAFT_442313 [Absidia repens]|uniref:Microtubule associated protein-domain-containing protein n=1 Tax=Absidia repens TaxID=90262 RepID=A0A1X2I2S6_9FUNG|nr:hypothetical protein BCR42DRAFT_442313 [Absidia repens]
MDPLNNGDKLEHVLRELDKVVEYEEWRKKLLVADIEDVMASIESGCQILGISMESLLGSTIELGGMTGLEDWEFYAATSVMTPTFERKKSLTMLNNRLANEIRQRRLHVKEWLLTIDSLCRELDLSHSFESYKSYYDELSWGTVQKISCALRDLTRKQTTNKNRFEHLAHCIHYYRTVLGEDINGDDSIDIALHNLCNSVNNDNGISDQFDINQPPNDHNQNNNNNNAFLYYRQPLAYPLSLKDDLMTNLQNKAHDLRELYNARYGQFNHCVNNIHTLWEELQIPNDKRCTIYQSLHKENLAKLQQNSDEMKTIIHVMIDEYLQTIRPTLEKLWDNCLLTQNERDEFLDTLYQKANKMDTARSIMEKHMAYLEYIQSSSQIVDNIMKERKQLIQKMIDFETSASDPRRLFQASFQLMEEERWRKTCFPTLLQLDDALIKAVQEFEYISEKHFLVGNRRYLDMLMDEIADRTANQTFFGFLNTEPNHDRPVRSKSRPNSLYASSVSTTTTTPKTLPLSESPTQEDITSFTDIQQRQRSNSKTGALKRRSLPPNGKKTNATTTDPVPSISSSTRPRKNKRLATSQSITSLPTPNNIIPQQYKSKSYTVVSRSKSTLEFRKNNNPPPPLPKIDVEGSTGDNNTNFNRHLVSSPTDDEAMDAQQLHVAPPPPPPRSKASLIPIRKQPSSQQLSPPTWADPALSSSASSSPTQQQQQQQETPSPTCSALGMSSPASSSPTQQQPEQQQPSPTSSDLELPCPAAPSPTQKQPEQQQLPIVQCI